MKQRIPWAFVIGIALLVVLATLVTRSWSTIHEALQLMTHARPGWLVLALGLIGLGFFAAGQVYGRALVVLGHRANPLWLASTALVAILISQSIPAGTVGSYAFLTASLRRRGISVTGVALIASLELLSWIAAMLLLFSFGLIYTLLTAGSSGPLLLAYPAAGVAIALLSSGAFLFSRPRDTLHDWGLWIKALLDRLFGSLWPDSLVLLLVNEIEEDRRLIRERPLQVLMLVAGQLLVFAIHSLALLVVLYSLDVSVSPLAVLAAFGLALIVSSFTLLPGGGGTVEAALTLTLTAQGVPTAAALGAALVFRMLNFWLLLPLAAIGYRVLTHPARQVTSNTSLE